MNTLYQTYHLKEGDTLEKLAAAFGTTPSEISSFHNTHCHFLDRIGLYGISEGLQKLLLPTSIIVQQKTQKKNNSNLILRNNPNTIRYGVLYLIEEGDQSDTLKYELSVTCMGVDEQGCFHYKLDKASKIFINNMEPDSMADEMAAMVSATLYPLTVIASESGGFEGINNFKDIQERWTKTKRAILNKYQGEWAEKYIDLNEPSFNDQGILERDLANDWLLCSFFNGVHVRHADKYSVDREILFPLIAQSSALRYKVVQKMEEYIGESSTIIVSISGNNVDERGLADLESGLDFPDLEMGLPEKVVGAYRAKYFINPGYNFIESLFVECSLELEKPKRVSVIVSDIGSASQQKERKEFTQYFNQEEVWVNKNAWWNKLKKHFSNK